MLALKTLEYAPGARLDYFTEGGVIVFCGTSNMRDLPAESNTTNALPDILKSLAKAIGKPVNALTFFELATSVNWVALQPGQYDFRSVKTFTVGKRVTVERKKAECPKPVLKAFRRHIGGDAIQKYAPEDEEDFPESDEL